MSLALSYTPDDQPATLILRFASKTYSEEVEMRSGVTFQEARVAHTREWMVDGGSGGST